MQPEPIACRITTADAARQAMERTDLHPRAIAATPPGTAPVIELLSGVPVARGAS
jgi:hypothetical protein